MRAFFVGLLGLEPRLFWTKTRRVASYTIGHCCNADANLKQSFISTNIFQKKFNYPSHFFQFKKQVIPQNTEYQQAKAIAIFLVIYFKIAKKKHCYHHSHLKSQKIKHFTSALLRRSIFLLLNSPHKIQEYNK